MTQTTCLIWQTTAVKLPLPNDVGGMKLYSPRAGGSYYVGDSSIAAVQNLSKDDKLRLTISLVEQRRWGTDCPEIYSTKLDSLHDVDHPSIPERADSLLRYLASNNRLLGDVVNFSVTDHSATRDELLAWTASLEGHEIAALAEYCGEEGWIKHQVRDNGSKHSLSLKPSGYAHLEGLDRPNSESHQAFIAMWFDPSMEEVYSDGIEPAVEAAGYESVRIDRKPHNNNIVNEIIATIRRSRFLVADFTHDESGVRGGVYYEAGFAHGLGIPVIFTCRKDTKVHFDTDQFFRIIWDDPKKLKEELRDHISATIGDGPLIADDRKKNSSPS